MRTSSRWPAFSALLLGSLIGIGLSRGHAAAGYASLRKAPDYYGLPRPEQLQVFSLGYRSALADLLFGKTLVEAGVCFAERRVFEALPKYLDAVVSLDPTYRDVYYYADSLLTLSTVIMPRENYRIARDLQARGRKVFPDDAELWMNSGMFMAYLAPAQLPESEDKREWRVAAARVLQHACDIWPTEPAPPGCLGASTLLSKAGERAANEGALRRLIAISDDPAVRTEALARLAKLLGQDQARVEAEKLGALAALQARDVPLATAAAYQMLGPPTDPKACTGLVELAERPACASSFRAWAEHGDSAQ
jgi:hypothetical protein